MLTVSQANALVYSALCGFMLVGLYAGWTLKSRKDFISGIRTQSTFPLTLNWIASNMSSSLLFAYPQIAVVPGSGILGLAAYAFATVVPLWWFAWLGPRMRVLCPEGFTLAHYVRVRFGWPIGVLVALIFVAFMLCFMITELNTFGSVVSLLGGVNPTIAALIVAIITTIYTAYGGFRASLFTDNFQAIVIGILIIIAAVTIGVKIDIQPGAVERSGLTKADPLGGQLWYILPMALIFSQMFNQGFWQRTFASKTNAVLYKSVAFATVPLFAICFLVGMTGPLAYWAGLFNGVTEEDDGSTTFFYILATLPNWVTGIILVLCCALTSSAYDTFQSAQISTIQNDVLLGRVNLWWCRAILLALNVPAVVLAVKNVDILQVFLIADLGGAAILPPVLLGLIPQLHFLNGFDAFVGAAGGFFSVFIGGTGYYDGDAKRGGALIGLPNGLYVSGDDYSVLIAFIMAPFGAVAWTLIASGFRLGATWLYYRLVKGERFVVEKRVWDTAAYALGPEDRPAGFAGIHGTGQKPETTGAASSSESDEERDVTSIKDEGQLSPKAEQPSSAA